MEHDHDDVLLDVLASLVAAVSLLKRGSKKVAPSDRMFDEMIIDYERSIDRGRAACMTATERSDAARKAAQARGAK